MNNPRFTNKRLNSSFYLLRGLCILLILRPWSTYASDCDINPGANQQICWQSQATLTATTSGDLASTPSYLWEQVSGPAITIATPNQLSTNVTNIPENGGAFVFKVTTTCNDASTVSKEVKLTVFGKKNTAIAGPDQCLAGGTTSTTLNGNVPPAGYKGAWKSISGPSAITLADASNATSALSGLINGTYELSWTISDTGNCESSSDTLLLTISTQTPNSNAGPDQLICKTSTALKANVPSPGTGKWTQTAGPAGARFDDASNPATTVRNLSQGTYSLKWTISNYACAAQTPSDEVEITVSLTIPNQPTGVKDVTYCINETAVPLTATAAAGSTLQWYAADKTTRLTGTPTPTTNIASTQLFYVSAITASGCESLQVENQITIVAPVTPQLETTSKVSLCNKGAITLMASSGSGSLVWTNTTTHQQVGIGSPLILSNITTNSVYVARDSIQKNCISSASAPVTVTVLKPVTPTLISASDTSVCVGGTVSLRVKPTTGTPVWYNAYTNERVGKGSPLILRNASISGNYSAIDSIAASCVSAPSNAAIVRVKTPTKPVLNSPSPVTRCKGDYITITANEITGTLIWINTTTNKVLGTGSQLTVSNLSTNTSFAARDSVLPGCISVLSNPLQVNIINVKTPTPLVSTIAICQNKTATLEAAPVTGTLNWYDQSTLQKIGTGNPFEVTPSWSTAYYAVEQDASGCESDESTPVQVNIDDCSVLRVTISASASELCKGDSVTLNATASASENPVQFQWETPRGLFFTQRIKMAPPIGQYYFKILAYNGSLQGRDSILISTYEIPKAKVHYDPASLLLTQGQKVFITASAGSSDYSFYFDGSLLQQGSDSIAEWIYDGIAEDHWVQVYISNGHCSSEFNGSLSLTKRMLPNIFTPNYDGINDVFLKGYPLLIFNRWGNLLYDGMEGWDGSFDGRLVTPGIYFYVVKILIDGRNETFKGTVSIPGH